MIPISQSTIVPAADPRSGAPLTIRTSRPIRRRLPAAAAVLVLALCLAAPAAAAPATPGDPSAGGDGRDAMEEQIRSWIASLAEHETFRTWTRATMDIQGLGPGTHGWLVTLLDKRLPIGYLVVYAGEDGSYRLGEYGLGPAELYNRATLRRSLEENGLVPASGRWTAERRYAHPLAAAWRVAAEEETYWLDAKTGELLPLDDPAWARIEAPEPAASAGSGAVPSGRIATWRLSETFDPYERLPWLTGEEAAAEKLLTRLLDDGRHLRFVSEPFGELMLYALPVVGYVRWTDGRIDLALDQNGVRWIPLDTLRSLGLFYR